MKTNTKNNKIKLWLAALAAVVIGFAALAFIPGKAAYAAEFSAKIDNFKVEAIDADNVNLSGTITMSNHFYGNEDVYLGLRISGKVLENGLIVQFSEKNISVLGGSIGTVYNNIPKDFNRNARLYYSKNVESVDDDGEPIIIGIPQFYSLISGEQYTFTFFCDFPYADNGDLMQVYAQPFEYTYFIPVVLPEEPTKPHYDFAGWYLDEALTIPYVNQPLTDDTILYAKWTPKKYTITYFTNCSLVMNAAQADALSVFEPATNISRIGYALKGWYTDEALTQAYVPGELTGDLTLYAKWEVRTVKVTFIVDGAVYTTLDIPYGTALTSAQSLIKSLFNVKAVFYADEEMTEAANLTAAISEDVIVYGTAEPEETPYGFAEFMTDNWIYFVIGAGALLLLIIIIAAARKTGAKSARKYSRSRR